MTQAFRTRPVLAEKPVLGLCRVRVHSPDLYGLDKVSIHCDRRITAATCPGYSCMRRVYASNLKASSLFEQPRLDALDQRQQGLSAVYTGNVFGTVWARVCGERYHFLPVYRLDRLLVTCGRTHQYRCTHMSSAVPAPNHVLS